MCLEDKGEQINIEGYPLAAKNVRVSYRFSYNLMMPKAVRLDI